MPPLEFRSLDRLRPLSLPASPRRRWPWWVLLALAILSGVLGLFYWWWTDQDATDFSRSKLSGPRAPGCVRLIVANDESGSMAEFSRPREEALNSLLAWAPRNLRRNDQVAVVSFAETASVAIAPTNVGQSVERHRAELNTGTTRLGPLLAAVHNMPATSCTTALVLLSDGIFDDPPPDDAAGRTALRVAGIDELYFLVPGKDIKPWPDWPRLFPYAPAVQFDGTNADQTALTIGRTLATITGQRLTRTVT